MEKKLQKPYCADYTKFMASSLILVNNLAEGILKTECKNEHFYKKSEACGIKYKYCECCLKYMRVKDLIECKCLCCSKNYQKSLKAISQHIQIF